MPVYEVGEAELTEPQELEAMRLEERLSQLKYCMDKPYHLRLLSAFFSACEKNRWPA